MSILRTRTVQLLSKPRSVLKLARQAYGVTAISHANRNFSSSSVVQENISDVKVTDRMSLKGRNIFVTGGGRGIGFAICKAIAQLGGNVAVIDALPEPVEEFYSLESKYGVKAFYLKADVTQQQSLESAFSEAVKQNGPFQGCVPAAGIALDKPITDHAWDESQRILMVNTMGTFWTAKLMAEHVKEHGLGASIVMIASVAAQGIKVSELLSFRVFRLTLSVICGYCRSRSRTYRSITCPKQL